MVITNFNEMLWYRNPRARQIPAANSVTARLDEAAAWRARRFHQTLPGYVPTPLRRLSGLADYLGIADLRIKDESLRCGLNAFKVLGASYALSHALSEELGMQAADLEFTAFLKPGVQNRIKHLSCITATDGNHGRALAWIAQRVGCRCVVYMPKGTSAIRLQKIEGLGAEATIIDGNYDQAVLKAAEDARRNGWLLIQDTAWPGYEEIPSRIMQGYLTMYHEAFEQLNGEVPTHVFIQCGVGALAGSLQAYLLEKFGQRRPVLTVAEPTTAACFYESVYRDDDHPHAASGNLETLMAGLSCGQPSILAWEILRDYGDMFVACPDFVTEKGMRILGNPLAPDDRIISGESGAVTAGLLFLIMQDRKYKALKENLALGSDSKILLFSTEGDTDPQMYRQIVWTGPADHRRCHPQASK